MPGGIPAVYGARRPPRGSAIVSVDPDSPAARAGIRVGEVLSAAGGHPLTDVIEWQWVADGAEISVEVKDDRGNLRTVLLSRASGETWGITFADVVFDGVRTCDNECTFCFMSQNPPGLRGSLYLKDDDYRLSFLQGNFVTLTNMSDEDVDRVVRQRLSPLYVSLHAVDPDVRARLICARHQDRAVPIADELLAHGIALHVQIVLVPGVNDGEVLEETLRWLADRDSVLSVGIVPIGLTGVHDPMPSSFSEPALVEPFMNSFLPTIRAYDAHRGPGWLQLADEFYLDAGIDIPPADEYGGFPQYENGIGMVRAFIDGLPRRECSPTPATSVLTGTLFAPVLRSALAETGFSGVDVLPVQNALFAGNVGVAGLISGADIIQTVAADAADHRYLVPECIFNADGFTLDDMTFDQLSASADGSLTLVSCDPTALVDALCGTVRGA
jgi:putative radical SAM enzyme (TIGR03279 family)